MKHRFPSLLFVALCGLAPAALGNLLHWSAWLWGFMCMVTASGSLLLVMMAPGRGSAPVDPHEPREPEPPAAPSEQPYEETRVVDAALPSSADGYDFLFSATVWWRPTPGFDSYSDGASPALAVASIVSRALAVVHHEEPGRASFARYLLEGELGVPLPDRSGRVKALAADVTLTLAPADRERLRKLSDLRKDEEVWEYERHHERNKRRYLGDDVLKSAGSAVVWWLARHENEIEKAVDMIGPLAQIAAAANDEEVPELFRHLLVPPVGARTEATVGGPLWDGHSQEGGAFNHEEEVGVSDRLLLLLAAVGLKPDMDEYTVFVHRVVRSLEAAGLDEAAEEIRRTLLPTSDEGWGEGPEGRASDEGDSTGTWSSHFSGPEGSQPTDAGAATFTPGAAASDAGERNQGWQAAATDDTPPPHSWDTLQNPHGPAAPHARDTDDEGGS
ncbi:hypothetical protein GCM10010371_13830 [Streptomyces subrutilus]|uniref:Uncharacterized protein n=1 Tax=Streptomyces subrutilus TaxID=36818 RepID=A0A5P2UFX1_9ACTN|nr:hypothetical protein [Streptomyces subrutilus]QEU78153.1 hypothetical protein CP968_07530 [Streptomyces subrutilus]GGZ55567.1 hypothetical protein GCM10010371_13830 [Streptomyces subrutilus]